MPRTSMTAARLPASRQTRVPARTWRSKPFQSMIEVFQWVRESGMTLAASLIHNFFATGHDQANGWRYGAGNFGVHGAGSFAGAKHAVLVRTASIQSSGPGFDALHRRQASE